MVAGAPRTVSLEPSEMIELGKEMIQWLSIHPEALHISAWYSIEKGITESAWETMIRRAEFVGYYDIARRIVGLKYLDKDSKVRDNISHRWLRLYFKDLKQLEDQDKDDDVVRQKSVAEAVPEDVKKQTQAMNDQVKALRESLLGKEQ